MIRIGVKRHHFLNVPCMWVYDEHDLLFYRFYHGNWECMRGAKRLLNKFKKGKAKIVSVL